MKAAEIINLKRDLCVRLDALRIELNLSPENNFVPELDLFRSKSGFAKLWYFIQNRTRITAAAEYESLVQLINDAPKLSPEDQNLLEVFGEGKPGVEYQIQDQKTSTVVEELKKSLRISLALTTLSALEKNALIHDFWNKFQSQLSNSPAPSDQIMSRYMQDRTDLGLKVAPIILMRVPETTHAAPSFFENLPSSGNRKDFEEAAQGHTTPTITPSLQPTLNTPLLQVNIASTTKIFFFFSCTFLQDVENNVKQRKTALDGASEFLKNTRRMPSEYMGTYINQLKLTIEQWKQAGIPVVQPPRQQPTAPVIPSAAQQMLNYVAPLIPGVPKQTLSPQTVTTTATTTENTWLPSFPSLFGGSTTPAPQTTTPNQTQNNSWFSSLW